jgi:hypothetical protein
LGCNAKNLIEENKIQLFLGANNYQVQVFVVSGKTLILITVF